MSTSISATTTKTKFREKSEADAFSPHHKAVANELRELSLHLTSSLLPFRDRSNVLQLKLQQRRSREELINQGIMPQMSAEPSLQAKQLQLKKARLAVDLNDKISHRPGPMELVHKNILPVHSSIKQAIETQFPMAPGENSSCDEDSNDSLSPQQPVGQESPLGVGPLLSLPETLAESSIPSHSQVPPSAPLLPSLSGSSPSWKQDGTVTPSAQNIHVTSQITSLPKSNSDRSGQKHKKTKDSKPKIKKLKYHQYIPPDQKGDKEPLPHLDSSYAKVLQQQQLFLQLQILSQQQQQQYNYHTILPAPPNLQENQQPSSSSNSKATSSPPQPLITPSISHSSQSLASLDGTKPLSLPLNLDEMKVVELKSELKLRSLPVSGTKPDLIERLRTYQEMNGGSDSFSSPTAGGTTGSGAEGAGRASQTAAAVTATTITNNDNNVSLQQPFQCHQTSSLTSHSGCAPTPPIATPQPLLNSSVKISPLTLSNHPTATSSPEDTSFNSDPLEEMMRSPLSQSSLQPCSPAQLPVNIKDELTCSTPAPCQVSLKPATLEKHCLVSSRASSTTTTAPLLTIDKDKMLQEKDKKIKELTRMLRQSQKLVDLLRMQLEQRKRATRVTEPVLFVRVKQELPDHASVPLSSGHPSPHPQKMSLSVDTDFTKVNVKDEVTEAEKVFCEKTMQSLDSHKLQHTYTQTRKTQEQIQPHIEPQKKQGRHNCLQQKTLQLVQQQAIQKLLLQQQQNTQNTNHVLENQQNLQKLLQQRKKKSYKQQLKQLQKHQQSKQLQQQMQPKQQILTTQQKSPLQQQITQQQTIQQPQIQMQTTLHFKQQQDYIKKQQGSTGCFLPLFKCDSTQALVTDSNGNHFLITLGNPVTENQRTDPEGKATNHITLQDGDQLSEPQQVAAQCLSAPPSMQPFLKDQEAAPSGRKTLSPTTPNDTEHEDDFIDIILQTGGISTPFKPTTNSPLDLNQNSTPPSSPLPLLLSSPIPPSCDTPQPTPLVQPQLQTLVDTAEERQHLSNSGSGRLEDFLESTTGKPLLGVEPGGLLTLIDDLHSYMLCTPSILDNAPSPMDTFEDEHVLDSMDWLDLCVGRESSEESLTMGPLGPQTPPSVFSTDFLDSSDFQLHWDSCL